MASTMKAVVIRAPGGPEVLKLEQLPIPKPTAGHVLIRVKAFGLNRSEMFTRQGHSPSVQFPRVLGIEAVGVVEDAPGGEFGKGAVVATAMGGIGRAFDGGYAEYTCPPANQIKEIKDMDLEWDVLGALPEMFQTSWGTLMKPLKLQRGDSLLIRGGTTSIGLCAASIAKEHGCMVASTTRKMDQDTLLKEYGVDHVIIDDGSIADKCQKEHGGFDKVLELIGTATLKDSLKCTKKHGIVCMTGIVGNAWAFEFSPMADIPTDVYLTKYSGDTQDFIETPFTELVHKIKVGKIKVPVGKTYKIDDIVEAHKMMDSNKAGGKIVVLV